MKRRLFFRLIWIHAALMLSTWGIANNFHVRELEIFPGTGNWELNPTDTLLVSGDDIREIGRPAGAALEAVNKARGFIASLKESGNYLRNLAESFSIDQLPVGVKTQIGNIVYTMAISAMRLKPTHAEVDLYLEIDLPGEEEDPVFGAFGVAFSRKGGFAGDVKLALLGSYPIDLRSGKSRIVLSPGVYGNNGTFAIAGCEGFKELNVAGYLVFSRDWLIPVQENELQNGIDTTSGFGDERVTAGFSFNAQSWDFVVSLQNFKPFRVAGISDVVWEVGEISLDFSDFANPGNLSFPEGYQSPFLSGNTVSDLWRGVYIEEVRVKLPDRFSKPNAPAITVDAARIIIDNQGFTGRIGVYNILPLSDGNAGGWAFSVDTFLLDIMAMQIREGSMAGLIHVPLLSKNNGAANSPLSAADCIGYQGVIGSGGHYIFTALPGSDYHAQVWKAAVTIASNSTISLEYESGVLTAGAVLHGSVGIESDFEGAINIQIAEIAFSQLALSSQQPYFQSGIWDFPGSIGASMGGFSLNFSEISLQQGISARDADLRFIATLELAGGNTAISASGGFRIEGRLEDQSGHSIWRFQKLKVDHILVSASTSAWGLAGELGFYEQHPVFGNGFRGGVKVWFAGASAPEAREDPVNKGIAAIGQFGSMHTQGEESFRYFFVDVMATFGSGVDIGSLKLLGIGGGVYNRMSPLNQVSNLAAPPSNVAMLGSSLSGIVYQPDITRGFRIKANLVVASPGAENGFSVNGTFEVVMNSSSGLDTIRIYGNVTMFGPVNWDNSYEEDLTGVSIFIEMLYDNVGDERGFTASADVFVNIAQGKVRGASHHQGGLANYAGSIDLKFTNISWYVNVGIPQAPIALKAMLGPVTANLSAYLDIGNAIPPMPPLPDYVSAISGGQTNFMRNESLLGTGAGFAFGVSALIASGKKYVFPAFYYELAFGLGFDILLQDYGNVQCANNNSGRIGINGWYASGQAWAYLQGGLGIRVNLAFVQGEFEIMQAALAAILQAKGPNPFWAGARIHGSYRILGGLVKGSFRMKVELGEECTMIGEGEDPMANLKLIMRALPDDGQGQIPVTARPSVLTNLPFDEVFEMDQEQYKLIVLHASIQRNGQVLGSTMVRESGDNYMELIPREFLPANSTLEFKAKVALMKKGSYFFSDTIKIEEKALTFTTGESLDSIPRSNIAFSYPMDGQQNVYLQESPQGYLQLRQGQEDLLNNNLKIRFTASGGPTTLIDADYHAQDKRITFEIPPLLSNRVYRMEICTQTLTPGGIGQGGGGHGGPFAIVNEYLVSSLKVVNTRYFRTSIYPTFSSKVNAIPLIHVSRQGHGLVSLAEPFGSAELIGSPNQESLINFEVNLADNEWYESGNYAQLLYEALPMESPVSMTNNWRDEAWGAPPVKAIQWYSGTPGASVSAAHFSGGWPSVTGAADSLHLSVHKIINQDFFGYKNQLDSLLESWAALEMQYTHDFTPQQLMAYDYNGDGVFTTSDLRSGMLNHCNEWNCNPGSGIFPCPQFSGIVPCPLPSVFSILYQASGNPLGSARGKTFEVSMSYTLPGKSQPNSVAILRVKISQ